QGDARRVRLRLAAAGLDLGRVLRLAADTPVADLRGRVDVRAKYDEAGDRARAERRITGSASGRDLALRAQGVPGLWLRGAELSRFDLDLGRRSVALGALRLRGPEVWVRRTGSELTIPGLAAGLASPADEPAWTVTLALPPLAALARSPLRLESGNASGAFDIAYGAGGAEASGTLVVADVKTISPDPARPEDVLALKEARLALRQAGSAPPSVAFERVEIDWPYVLVDRSAEGIFPFSLLAASAPGPAERAPLPTVRIDALRVRGPRIDFRDATLSPPYWRALANLGLEARAVEAPAVRVGELRASGLVDELSPLSVEGTI